ncbi:MAG: hypothetical protein HY869_06270 [Chloroflexi bacterium]|nr:hypothetical protein [Chloroflexota bacterium]
MDPRDRSLVEEMVSEILRQTLELELERRRCFLEWLQAHCNRLNMGGGFEAAARCEADMPAGLKDGLNAWFDSLSAAGILWEFRLLLSEISWWQSLDERKFLKDEVKCSNS